MKNKTKKIQLFRDDKIRVTCRPVELLKAPSGDTYCREWTVVYEKPDLDSKGKTTWQEDDYDCIQPDFNPPVR